MVLAMVMSGKPHTNFKVSALPLSCGWKKCRMNPDKSAPKNLSCMSFSREKKKLA